MVLRCRERGFREAAAAVGVACHTMRLSRPIHRQFEEDERIERLNAQRRRQKLLDRKSEVERLIAERREMYERMRALEAEQMVAEKYRRGAQGLGCCFDFSGQ